MEVTLNGTGAVHGTHTVGESTVVTFSASHPTRNRNGGIHARVDIHIGNSLLAWDDLNINKDRTRNDLVNSAYRPITAAAKNGRAGGEIATIYPKEDMKHHFDLFCAEVWPVWVSSLIASPSAGDAVSNALQFVAEPHVIQDGGTIIFAPPGRGKSHIALICAISVDAGSNAVWDVQQKRVLIVNLERGHGSYVRRLALVNRALLGDAEEERALLIMTARGHSLSGVKEAVEATIERHNVEFLLLDSISRAGFGDLNENDVGNSIVDTLSSLCPTWMAIGHSPRSDATHVFGSVMYDCGADLMVQVLSEQRPKELGLGLKITKANDTGQHPLKVIGLEFNDFGLTSIRKAREVEYPELTDDLDKPLPDRIADYILQEAENSLASAEQIAKAVNTSRTTVWRTLRNNSRFVARKIGREDFYGVRSDFV